MEAKTTERGDSPHSPDSSGDVPATYPAFGHWLAGFADGEACFALLSNGRGKVRAVFRIALRQDDEAVLRQIRNTLGVGNVRLAKAGKLGCDQAEFNVLSKPDCLAMVEFFERYPLRSKKARDFEIWKRAVRLWQNYYKGQRYADWTPMQELADQLRAIRAYENGGKPGLYVAPPVPIDPMGRRDDQIAELWLAGATCLQIASALEMGEGNVQQRVMKMRRDGRDLPIRYRGKQAA